MNQIDLILKLRSALPSVHQWIDETLKKYNATSIPVIDLSFSRLKIALPFELLSKARVVVVNGKVPFPPLSQMGLPEFKEMENMTMAGITFKNTFFVNQFHQTESLYFHELVHVVQWERLGANNFLLAYGVGLMNFGYQNSPLEKMAYSLQTDFDDGILPMNTVGIICQQTDDIWNTVSNSII